MTEEAVMENVDTSDLSTHQNIHRILRDYSIFRSCAYNTVLSTRKGQLDLSQDVDEN